MSTKIYDAVKIRSGNIKALVGIAKKISEIELRAMTDEAVKKYHSLVKKAGLTIKTKGIKDTVRLISALVGKNEDYGELINVYAEKRKYPLTPNTISLLWCIADELSGCKKLSFLGVDAATTLMKWYSLSGKTEEWIYSHFEDYHYQNSTDGYTIKDVIPSIVKDFDEYTEDFLLRYTDENEKERCLQARKKTAADLAFLLFSERAKVWDKAMNQAFVMSECSLSYELSNSWNNDLEHLIMRVIALCDKEVEGVGET